jgi:predicted MFS family arabinose efflux permease
VPAAPASQAAGSSRCEGCPALSGGTCPAGPVGCAGPGRAAPWPARAGLALAAGVAGAVLYEAQPLLGAVDRSLRSGPAPTGLLSALPQLGLALGLVLLLPLADRLPRRRLFAGLAAGMALASAAAALSPGLAPLALAVLVIGALSVLGQVAVPLAAEVGGGQARLASQVGGSLLAGAVLSRTLAGVVGGWVGWRATYWLTAALLALAGAVSLLYLPPSRPLPGTAPYRRVLATMGRSLSGLERQAAYGALAFGCFGAAWTALPFLLAGRSWQLGPALIGLFGLSALGGLAGGSACARLVHRPGGSASIGAFVALAVVGWALLEVGGHSLPALAAGLVLLDVAVQALHLACRQEVDRRSGCSAAPAATSYMALALAGGAVGSALSGALWSWAGWRAACGLGLALAGAALAVWLAELVGAGKDGHGRPFPRAATVRGRRG